MTASSRKRRGIAPPLHLAILALLVFGAFTANAAQASPVWRTGGKTFTEQGIASTGAQIADTKESSFHIRSNSGTEIECSEVGGSGELAAPAGGNATVTAAGCRLVGFEKYCSVLPFNIDTSIGLTKDASGNVLQTFAPQGGITFFIKGWLCWWFASEVEDEETGEILGEVHLDTNGGLFGTKFPSGEAFTQTLTGSSGNALKAWVGQEPFNVWLKGPVGETLPKLAKFGAW